MMCTERKKLCARCCLGALYYCFITAALFVPVPEYSRQLLYLILYELVPCYSLGINFFILLSLLLLLLLELFSGVLHKVYSRVTSAVKLRKLNSLESFII
jgi:hypothetical protein